MKSHKSHFVDDPTFGPTPPWMDSTVYRALLWVVCVAMAIGLPLYFDMMWGTRLSLLAPYYSASVKVGLLLAILLGAFIGALHFCAIVIYQWRHRLRETRSEGRTK